ncbi:autophagy-related protein 16 [Nemania sp. FL0031]|nr:autophagy-related protein 16 [Nemania sp. FL0031]
MNNWRDDYLASLQEAERNNPANKDLVETCSQLADRVAALEAEKAAWASGSPTPSSTKAAAAPPAALAVTRPPSTSAPDPVASPEGTTQLRLDLAEAIRGRGQAQTRLKSAEAELATLRSKNRVDNKRISDLTNERNALTARIRDLNEELDKKRSFLKDVQDENLTLNMELNMTAQRAAKVEAENKELVDRWMKRMGHEADALNLQNESPKNHKK